MEHRLAIILALQAGCKIADIMAAGKVSPNTISKIRRCAGIAAVWAD